MTRPVRVAVAVAALAVIQVAGYLVYRAVERSRAARAPAAAFADERLRGTESAPRLDGARVDGSPVTMHGPADRIRVVHFWATWCKPCRTELPGLLALSRELRARGIDVVAVAVDDDWTNIRAFFDDNVPSEVVVAVDPGLHKRFGVSTLPDTYLVDRSGRLVARLHGARDWRSDAARNYLLGFLD